MASMIVSYIPASGFTPIVSGNPWSGRVEPVGGFQLRADKANSGSIYISLSGAFVFSGQIGCLPASGGPTITSGAMFLSGGISSGMNDGMQLGAGDAFFIPKISFSSSGTYQVCVGCDPACSGTARLYVESF